MKTALCGLDCTGCEFFGKCKGCAESDGRPFGEECIAAKYCMISPEAYVELQKNVIKAFNDLHIEGMDEVTELRMLLGSIINMEITLPGGQKVKFWNDNRIYFGNLLPSREEGKFFGIGADDEYLMVCKTTLDGSDTRLLVFKRWN